MWAAKIKGFREAEFHRVQKCSKTRYSGHQSARLLRSGHNHGQTTQLSYYMGVDTTNKEGRSSNEANGRDFEGFGTSRYAFIRVGCTNEADGRIFETFCYAFARSMVNPRVKADGRVFMVLSWG